MRVEAVALEHHGDAAGARRDVVDDLAADHDVAGRLLLEAGDDAQKGRLAAARRPEQHHEFAVPHGEADPVDGGNLTKFLGYPVGRTIAAIA